ncbi:hypothetical protein B0H67DRAFT_599481 [Lasiosphaeris hirsuta]|uniref:Uncharacterized protein n=1 Tax=Lasiosphaeris hirsuta TaxID=260670 RepID=A0AA40AQ18_9PEZI|nr:hypothetical protein B0H67DRAFT_599481 [Lasiosphaeris hirsuta]
MAFIQDPRMRQRWNQISHNAETVTENAAAGIWTFQNRYINPCLNVAVGALDSCTGVCFGDREERARRARERDRGARRTRAEYSFDFYDDWEDADDEGPGGGGGILGGWGGGRSEDWDRLLAGTGGGRSKHGVAIAGEVADQPRRKRGMSYGTRGVRRKVSGEEDPTIIPRTAPLGFLGRLPFNIGGTLRYKPSAANLQDHPGAPIQGHGGEHEPLLGTSEEEDAHQKRSPQPRPRSNTAESGDTSSSYRSRGDLFPSDGEGDEDAVPLDDEFAMALDRVDDRGSTKTRSSKGKQTAGMSRTISRTTIDSTHSRDSAKGAVPNGNPGSSPFPQLEDPESLPTPSLEELQREEELAEREEAEEIERRRRAASQLALRRGLNKDELSAATEPPEPKILVREVKDQAVQIPERDDGPDKPSLFPAEDNGSGAVEVVGVKPADTAAHPIVEAREVEQDSFVPAKLPNFR